MGCIYLILINSFRVIRGKKVGLSADSPTFFNCIISGLELIICRLKIVGVAVYHNFILNR